MLVEVYEGLEVIESHNTIRRVEIELENGQRFTFKERENLLSVSTDGQILVLPRGSNLLYLMADAQ